MLWKKITLIAAGNHIITLQFASLYPSHYDIQFLHKYVQIKMRAAFCALLAENLQIDEI